MVGLYILHAVKPAMGDRIGSCRLILCHRYLPGLTEHGVFFPVFAGSRIVRTRLLVGPSPGMIYHLPLSRAGSLTTTTSRLRWKPRTNVWREAPQAHSPRHMRRDDGSGTAQVPESTHPRTIVWKSTFFICP